MNDLTVKRSNNLIEARYNLSSGQNDIIDLVLSKIADDNELFYTIEMKDYSNLFDDSTHIYRDLKKATKEFKEHNSGFTLFDYKGAKEQDFFWFVKIQYLDKQGKIIFKLDTEVKEIMLQLKNVTYYNIKYTLNMSSIYSKRIYLYLKRFEDTGIRIDKVEDLLNKLNCPESYKKYTFFKKRVIKVAQKEINGNTDINFTYDEIKTGRKVTLLKFYIKKNTTNPLEQDKPNDLKQKSNNEFHQPLVDELDEDDLVDELHSFIVEPLKTKDLRAILKTANNDIQLVKDKYELAQKQNKIENLTAWLISAIENDFSEPISRQKKNKFINYEQDDWDFEKLERLEREYIDKRLNE